MVRVKRYLFKSVAHEHGMYATSISFLRRGGGGVRPNCNISMLNPQFTIDIHLYQK